jgi:hypothetical protein
MKEFEAKQEVLKDQVDFVLKKVSEMLNLYETEMKPEIKIEIRKYVDKVLRIKSSTNLDYIRKTCEELLTYLQQEEIFLHQENKQNERTQMVMQAKTMMMQLHSNKNTSGMDIGELLRTWRQEHILNNPQPNTLEKSLNFLASLVIGFAPENKEITELRHDLNIIGAQVWQYWQLYFQATTPEYKTEARNSLKKLSLEKKKLKLQLKEAKKRLHEEFNKNNEITPLEKFNLELLSFTGWLLGFYLAYYFISIYLNTKQLGIAWLPVPFSIYKTNFLKYFLTTIFLFHSSLSVKLNFFRRNEVATLVITPVFLLSTLLIILNF